MVNAIMVISRIYETLLILRSSTRVRYVSSNQHFTEVVLNFMDSMIISGPLLSSYLYIFQ